MRMRRSVVSAFIAVAVSATSAFTQAVRGTVVDPAGAPVSGVVVLLLDSLDAPSGRALTNDLGGFLVRAQKAGTYRIRTLRIGFKPEVSEPIALDASREVQRRITLTSLAVALDKVTIAGRNACGASAVANASATLELLDQARAALTATELTNEGRTLTSTSVVFRRVMDASGRAVLGQRVSVLVDSGAQPWQSTPIDTLRRVGYVSESGDSLIYRAPGLDMLASEAFIADHCFRLVEEREGSRVGIAFEPSPERRRIGEIRGTLWLDRATAELREMDFRFANVETAITDARAGGNARFARMKDGSWVITAWNIRMPVLQMRQRQMAGRSRTSGSGGDITVEIASQNVVGGSLSVVTRSDQVADTLWKREPLTVTGVVVDSATGTPAVDARLALRGAGVSALTDTRGAFTMTGVLPGSYTLELRTPSLDSVGAVNALAWTLTDSVAPIRIRVPNATQLATSMCGGSLGTLPPTSQGIVFGAVTILGSDSPASRASVVAEWTEGADDDFRWKEVKADDNGRFRLCGVPIGKTLVLRAMTDSGSAEPALVTIARERKFARTEMEIDPAEPGTGVFAGLVVRDTANNPIEGAEVVISGAAKSMLTGKRGAFRLREVPVGEHEVMVRKLGYGPMTTKVTFAPNKTVTRRIVLSAVQVLNQVDVMAERMRDPMLKLFEENRKMGIGQFLTRDDLERMRALPLSSALRELTTVRLATQSGKAWIASARGCLTKPNKPQFEGKEPTKPIILEGNVCCFPSVYLDRMRLYGGEENGFTPNLNTYNPDQIEAVEFYPGLSTVPAEYAQINQRCGVLVLHTRRFSAKK
jgi:hypothetical protein